MTHLNEQAAMVFAICCAAALFASVAVAQPYGQPDQGEPGDPIIQANLAEATNSIHSGFAADLQSLDAWEERREQYEQEYLYMLGLWPMPAKTPLQATVTNTWEGDGFEVDMVHFQSRPGLYVTSNLYRPAKIREGERLPAVLYVCGHSSRGRNGNKTAFQSHGIWFARHGYICLIVDTLQLGEIAAIHHGTYREQRWWWHSRGYTPAGVECWNGVRGIDYLVGRPDVDPTRIAVTGISGGGAATFWIAAADERVRVAVPVSGMADLPSYVPNRVINGHCDCMFLYNTFEWPWTRIAALIAPRPLLFVNSDQDPIFPMDANDRVINRLERIYSLYEASDQVDAVVSIGGHAYRKDIRQAAFRFINTHLQQDPREVTDSEVDLVTSADNVPDHPIPPAELRVFRTDADIPRDELNTTIDQHFVPQAEVAPPTESAFPTWRKGLLAELRRVTFRTVPDPVPTAKSVPQEFPALTLLETEPKIQIHLRRAPAMPAGNTNRVVLVVTDSVSAGAEPRWLAEVCGRDDDVYFCAARGCGNSRWTSKNPPNFVERSLALLGSTMDTGRIHDIAATARYLIEQHNGKTPVFVAGEETMAVLAAYAALLEPNISGAILHKPPMTHMADDAPQLLNVLRVCDIPTTIGMLAPRPLVIHGDRQEEYDLIAQIYQAAGAAANLTVK